MRFALASLALSSVLLFAGCTAQDESVSDSDDIEASEDELDLRGVVSSRPLTNVTVVKGALREGDALTVPYAPALYGQPAKKGEVPYLAIALPASVEADDLEVQTAEAKPASIAVSVAGDFPSSPQLVVTDAKFRVLARAKGSVVANGIDSASVKVPNGFGDKFVLVRDPQWDKPMTFNLALGR